MDGAGGMQRQSNSRESSIIHESRGTRTGRGTKSKAAQEEEEEGVGRAGVFVCQQTDATVTPELVGRGRIQCERSSGRWE